MHNIKEIGLELDSLSVAQVITCDIEEVKQHTSPTRRSLNIITQNICSINCNMPNFTTLLQRSNIAWDIMVLSESWLHLGRPIPVIDNYEHASTTRHRTQNEGVVIYYNKHLNVTIEEPLVEDANCLILKLNQETCIIAIYRPPRYDVSNFMSSIDTVLSKLSHFKNIVLCGDINIDIRPECNDKRSQDYLNLLASHYMLPAHTEPTHGRTCLDHVNVKTKLEATCFVIQTSITDHDTVAFNLILETGLPFKCNKAHRIDYELLDKAIQQLDFQPILDSTDTNLATNMLITYLSVAIKESTKPHWTPKRKMICKPWVTTGLLRCLKNRDNLHKKMKQHPDNEVLKLTYRRYRSFCTSALKKAKRLYEKQEIDRAQNNKRKLWETIKAISGSKQTADHSSLLVSSSNPQESLDDVNNYFVNIGRRLAERINPGKVTFNDCDINSIPSPQGSFALAPVDVFEVTQIISSLRERCAVGIDLISSKVVKRYATFLVVPITHICNLAISNGVFPSAFKVGLIKPVHKGGDRDCVDNYRPISVLPTLSKILERLINNRLVKFLEENSLLSPSQYGFRRGMSTNDAVHDLVHSIVTSLDDKKKCVVIFLDLAKAFDTVSIPRLLNKLEKVGVRGLPLKLLEDYLSNRTQRVKIDHWISEEASVTHGVPQGSIIGPTLFLVYINDLCQHQLNGGRVFTFADDTALFFSGDSWSNAFSYAQMGFDRVNNWLRSNLLTLNVTKTKYVTFAIRASQLPSPAYTITAHGCSGCIQPSVVRCLCPELQRTESIKYLGVIIDQTLTFKTHIETLASRLRKLIFIFKGLRNVASRGTIRTVYYALGHSLLEYCISAWGGAAKTHMICAERAQRSLLKVAAGLPFRFPTSVLYNNWDLLTVRKTFILKTILKKHSLAGFDPELLKGKRRKGKVCTVTKLKTSFSHSFFCFLGPYLYNKFNGKLDIYPLPKASCKSLIIKYLKPLNYEETENILHPLK